MDTSRKPAVPDEHDGVYTALRPLLLAIAYDMLGAVGEAEDIVQEAFLRFHREVSGGLEIASPRAWLSTVTTRLAIDHVTSARVRRESYVGTWLPEPLLSDAVPDVAQQVETADALSMAFLVLLERLSPVERAVFLLRDVFDFGFDEIAGIVGKSEDNCRQIAVRARRHVHAGKARFEPSRERRDALARQFFEALGAGRTDGLVDLLAADVVLYTDGGGKGPAFRSRSAGRSTSSASSAATGPRLSWPSSSGSPRSTRNPGSCSSTPRRGPWRSSRSTLPTGRSSPCARSAIPRSSATSTGTQSAHDPTDELSRAGGSSRLNIVVQPPSGTPWERTQDPP